jgi:hypothetical protein
VTRPELGDTQKPLDAGTPGWLLNSRSAIVVCLFDEQDGENQGECGLCMMLSVNFNDDKVPATMNE